VIPPDPQLEEIKQQAEEDKKNAMTERMQAATQNLLLRYGARTALSGTGVGSPLSL
jgi:hypothetical protein